MVKSRNSLGTFRRCAHTRRPPERVVPAAPAAGGLFGVHHPVAPSRRHTQEHDGRFGELRSLRWRDVDFVNANIHVRLNLPAHGTVEKMPKGKRVRSLPLWDQAARPFDALSQRGYPTGPDDLVFVGTTGGHLDYRTVKDEFYATLERAGFGHLRQQRAPFTFHDLRHSFGTLAVQVYPVTDVQVYMGHERIETTMRYVHFVPKVDAAAKGAAFIAAQMENVSPLCPEPTSSDATERNSEHLTTA